MHHPPFINHPSEIEHYDNLGEPGRSWLLSFLEEYEVEAVFCGHAHNYFYNLHNNTDLYTLPSITFVRPDFSAMFHVSPADAENGRNDVNKLGFSLLDIHERGHRLSSIRTYGLTEERGDTVVFCEVKSRASAGFADPAAAVDYRKQAKLRKAAYRWLQDQSWHESLRFDVAVVVSGKIRVIEDAF